MAVVVIIIQCMHSKKFCFTHYLLLALVSGRSHFLFLFLFNFLWFSLILLLANFRLWLTNVFISTAALFFSRAAAKMHFVLGVIMRLCEFEPNASQKAGGVPLVGLRNDFNQIKNN